VQGDPFYLNHALSNLVDNAYRYTPAGAIIVSARTVNGSVEVSVSDTGVGIPPEEQKRLFRQFIRGEHDEVRSQKGTGLGLSIAHSIVEAHRGRIWVDSEVGKGSTFCFAIPVAAELDP
jgi:signal transduction histidine kinase